MTTDSAKDSRTMDFLLVTGLSGAGLSTAAKVLEDLGWYVADNLPPELISRMVGLSLTSDPPVDRLAVVIDVQVDSSPAISGGCSPNSRRSRSTLGCCTSKRPTTC